MKRFTSGFVYHAWLASAMLSPLRLAALLENFGSPEEIHGAFAGEDPGFRELLLPEERRRLRAQLSETFLQRMDQLLTEHSIRAFTLYDSGYPALLREISDPPAILFWQGNPGCLEDRTLSIVGSRSASYNGRKATRNLSRELSTHGVTIVSGMAGGIDSEAHRGCLEGNSPTVAVTGCGLDRVYPAGNEGLRDEILNRGGAILSEFAPGEKPLGWHFPIRNRIITGLSTALILMEAQIRSGSMTSVRHALDQGRDVFVYPGDPASVQFEGNHQLLREGGIYFTSAGDILEDLRWLDNPSLIRQNSDCAPESVSLSREEKIVLEALKGGALGFEALSEATGLESPALLGTLTLLQVRGMLDAAPGKIYQLKE